jgi:hypothetical protein
MEELREVMEGGESRADEFRSSVIYETSISSRFEHNLQECFHKDTFKYLNLIL